MVHLTRDARDERYGINPAAGETRYVDHAEYRWDGEAWLATGKSEPGWAIAPRRGEPEGSRDHSRYHKPVQPGVDALAELTAAAGRLETDSSKRKEFPMYSGLFRYFPDALAEVAALSLHATKQHHPGKPMHWDRSKSDDELDALCRHLAEAGTLDTDSFFHDVKIAWRSLANLQKLLERVRGLPISPASKP